MYTHCAFLQKDLLRWENPAFYLEQIRLKFQSPASHFFLYILVSVIIPVYGFQCKKSSMQIMQEHLVFIIEHIRKFHTTAMVAMIILKTSGS